MASHPEGSDLSEKFDTTQLLFPRYGEDSSGHENARQRLREVEVTGKPSLEVAGERAQVCKPREHFPRPHRHR